MRDRAFHLKYSSSPFQASLRPVSGITSCILNFTLVNDSIFKLKSKPFIDPKTQRLFVFEILIPLLASIGSLICSCSILIFSD